MTGRLTNPSDYIARIAGLLRPGGLLVLTTPNIRSFAFLLQRRQWWVIGPNAHIYYFAPKTLRRLLVGGGLRVYLVTTTTKRLERWLGEHTARSTGRAVA